MTHTYKTQGTCSSQIEIELDNNTIKSIEYKGGCGGNLAGIALLVKGMKPQEAIEKLSGIKCGTRPTSCPDQLAKALKEIVGG